MSEGGAFVESFKLKGKKMKNKSNIIWALVAALVVIFTAWLSGYDFNARGDKAVVTFLTIITLGSVAWLAAEVFKKVTE